MRFSGKYGDWERITFLPGTAPLPRSNHCSVLFDEKIFIFGGGNKQQLFNDVWVYDIQQKTWECIETTGFIPSPRHYCSVSLINGVMYVHGGKDELGQDLHELYGFKIKNRCWYMFQNMGRAPSARFGHTMTPVGSKLYVIGGDHVNSATKGDDPLTIHILDNEKVSYPPEDTISPTSTTSTTFSQRRTSSPILPPGDRPPSISSNTTTTEILCQMSESTPVTSLALGSLTRPVSSRSTPMPTLAPRSTPSRSSSFQATPLVSPTCSSSQKQILSRPISSEKPSPMAPPGILTDVAKLRLSAQSNEKTTPNDDPYLHSPTNTATTLVPSNNLIPQHTHLSNDLSASPPIPHNEQSNTSMDYVNEESLLLQEIKSRDRTISEMKNKEHWWRTQVAKARGIGDQPMDTTADVVQQLHLMCFSDDTDTDGDDDNDDGHMSSSNGITDGRIKRLLFEQLVIAKAQARHIKRDIQATSKSVSMKLDHEDRIRKAALGEASHYKALCAALLLHQGKATTNNDGKENLLHRMENDDQLDGLGLYRAEQERRATRLKTNLDKVLQDNFAMKRELVTIHEESRANELQRYMVAKQLGEEHARAERTQAAYSAALKRLYMLQKRTHTDEQKHSVNQHHIKLLEDQLESIQHQLNDQQELKQNLALDDSVNLPASAEKNKDCIMEWESKNNEQQEIITTLKQQLAQATHLMRSLHTDLKKSTSDWSTVITNLKITKSEIESLST
ncbi:hypothetical protein BCR42DRAFT_127097 [Absidia repens]|uniref:Uncharacterized protein n=1 Tax=Absidia repens TaxID=90262 RepID=A0A1X2IWZ0_9FUNG|nr:hypothetical protein BCR42DRAFT_127097 [Absidia repens]